LIDEKRSNPDEDDEQYFVMGLSLVRNASHFALDEA